MATPMRKRQRRRPGLEPRAGAVRFPRLSVKAGPPKTAMFLSVSPKLYERLCQLVKSGLFGLTPEDAAERLISEQLRWILRQP